MRASYTTRNQLNYGIGARICMHTCTLARLACPRPYADPGKCTKGKSRIGGDILRLINWFIETDIKCDRHTTHNTQTV